MQPRISIITICYNSSATIRVALDSLLQQNYPLLEVVVVDGGSTDGTQELVKSYGNRIDKFVSEPDDGISDAFNKGIALATGDLIGVLNSDDVMLPGALAAIAAAYDSETDVYRGNMLLWNPDTDFSVREKPSMHFPHIPLVIHVCHGATFITKRAYEEYGNYDTSMSFIMDLDLLTRFYRKGLRFKQVDADIEKFRIGGATSRPLSQKKHEMRRFIKKNGGNALHFYLYYGGLVLQDLLKKALNLFGEDFKRRLRYGRNSSKP